MRKILLDTHALLWWLLDDKKLGTSARKLIENPRNVIFVSAASIWEISIKQNKGLLKLGVSNKMEAISENILPK